MTQMTEFDRQLTAWLDTTGPANPPDGLVKRAVAEAGRRRQAHVWVPFLERDFPMQTSLRLRPAPTMGWLVIVIAAILVLAIAILAVGALRRPLPPPFGLAGNGGIAFDADGHIVRTNADGTGRVSLTSGPAKDTSPSYSPDGSHIVFTRTEGTSKISLGLMRDDGSELRLVALPALAGPVNTIITLVWAPDSRSIAFDLIVPPEATPSIWTADTETATARRLTPVGTYATNPSWSPDGRRIAFLGSTSLEVMTIGGASTRLTTTTGDIGGVAWQPNGELIAFFEGVDHLNIHLIGSDGSNDHVVAPYAGDQYTPAWSPDGTRLAFMQNVKNAESAQHPDVDAYNRVVISSIAGSPTSELDPIANAGLPSTTFLDGGQFAWAPDGRSFVAFAVDQATKQFSVIEFDAVSGTKMRLVPAPGNNGWVGWQRIAR